MGDGPLLRQVAPGCTTRLHECVQQVLRGGDGQEGCTLGRSLSGLWTDRQSSRGEDQGDGDKVLSHIVIPCWQIEGLCGKTSDRDEVVWKQPTEPTKGRFGTTRPLG